MKEINVGDEAKESDFTTEIAIISKENAAFNFDPNSLKKKEESLEIGSESPEIIFKEGFN